MQKLLGIAILLILFANLAMAQDAPSTAQATAPAKSSTDSAAQDTVPGSNVSKTEISGGFTIHRYYEVTGNTQTMLGGYADIEHNIIQRWVGAEIQFSGAYKNQGAPGNLGIYTIMAGPTFYPLGHRKITVFAHILAGEGYYRNSIAASAGFPAQVNTHTSFVWTGGAGLDVKVSNHLAVRLAQFDYTQAKFFGGTVHESDTRISVGIVYRFGGK
jgi:opacity protein-like surface antigen